MWTNPATDDPGRGLTTDIHRQAVGDVGPVVGAAMLGAGLLLAGWMVVT